MYIFNAVLSYHRSSFVIAIWHIGLHICFLPPHLLHPHHCHHCPRHHHHCHHRHLLHYRHCHLAHRSHLPPGYHHHHHHCYPTSTQSALSDLSEITTYSNLYEDELCKIEHFYSFQVKFLCCEKLIFQVTLFTPSNKWEHIHMDLFK